MNEVNLDTFNRYVMNDIPIRLIRLSDMKFVGRDNVRKHFRGSVGWTPYDFDPSRHVKYAILSHRWLDGGEPTYEEMRAGTASGLGYEKLMKFCEKAREYGVEFGWSDTCCIDKSSSTELDESIRSMFRWYRNATICIVHLANSEAIEDVLFDEWTRRGWTLQELLAPYHIKFFNKHWIPLTGDINDKVSKGVELMETLERATGIPRHELCWFNAGSMRVDERMVWAARRKTTRVEDVAYSLMGMFDVSLQIEYGEGGERAFRRLMEAIMQAGDPSVLNWVGDVERYGSSRAIPDSPESFVGSPKLGLAETRLEMNMTTLGLRVPLVILPLNLRSYLDDCGINIALDCPLCPTIQVIITTSGYVPSQMEFALGIANYSIFSGRSSKVLGIRGKSTGLILLRESKGSSSSRLPPICKPRCTDFIGFKYASPQEEISVGWRLLPYGVGLVEVDFPNIPSGSVFLIDLEYLETVYL